MTYEELDVEYLKSIYENIYQIEILEHVFIFRALGREEYREIIAQELDKGTLQEAICNTGVLFPLDYSFHKGLAGPAEVVAELILDASGLLPNQAGLILKEHREEMQNFDFQIDCMIHEAFPEFSLEEISTWPLRKSLFYMSRAEWVLENLKGVHFSTLDLEEPEEVERQTREMPTVPENADIEQTASFKKEEANDFTEKRPLSEAEVMSMLQQEAASKGASIGNVVTGMDGGLFPELGWFRHEDELRGNFDD